MAIADYSPERGIGAVAIDFDVRMSIRKAGKAGEVPFFIRLTDRVERKFPEIRPL